MYPSVFFLMEFFFCQSVDSVHSSLKELHAAFGLLCKLNCQSVLGFIVEFEHV